MALSNGEEEIIRAHPIGEKLDSFRAKFKLTFPDADGSDLRRLEDQVDSEAGKRLVLQLLVALQSLSPALELVSHVGTRPLFEDIASLSISISSKSRTPALAAPLLQLVLKQTTDDLVWSAAFDLIDRTLPSRPTTPPPSAPSFKETPWSHNTGSLADTSEPRSLVNHLLKEELRPGPRLDVPDFQQAIFGSVKELEQLAKMTFDRCQEGDEPLYVEGKGWVKWPSDANQEFVLAWLKEHTAYFSRWAKVAGRHLYHGPGDHLDGSTGKRKMDVGITSTQKDDLPISKWAEILVVGELKSNPDEDNQSQPWLDLATYVREVFHTQDRRFVLAFSICGSITRLWHFDRLGSSASLSFDINKDGYKFVYAMLGYLMMDDQQLGRDPTIGKIDGKIDGNRFVKIVRNGRPERLILIKTLRKQAVIVGRATTCWKAFREGDLEKMPLVVKDSWQYPERPEEGEYFKEATKSGVRHIPSYYHHETVQVGEKDDDILSNVRCGQMKMCGRTSFRQRNPSKPDASDPDASGKILAGRLESRSISRKRSSSSIKNPSPPKRSRSSQLLKDEDDPLCNRVHRRIVTRDAYKPIDTASSLAALLNGLIGAINGHMSLLSAGFLHRDISTGNIMLSEDEKDGFLIDLDLAVKTSNDKASGAPSKTGTKIFMAIGALYGEHHTFMHDLESFFWVLFWICIHWNGPGRGRRKARQFENWNFAATEELAKTKKGTVDEDDKFSEEVDRHFTAYCQPLVACIKELRKVVFPGGKRRTSDDRTVYSQMKAALEKARERMITV